MKFGNKEVRHVKGRTVRVERFKMLKLSADELENYEKKCRIYDHIARPRGTEHYATAWTVTVLGFNDWIDLFKIRCPDPETPDGVDMDADLFEHCFIEAKDLLGSIPGDA